ncbi:MAG: MurR/RpiR family transcriptional regulator [Chloroflexi bacterium]|nr:MurR/RpiR family transcriptional regulator [Chloroflexota bacterium]
MSDIATQGDDGGLLQRLRALYPELTKSQKRLADYILGSYQQAAFMTATQLARQLQLNEATVVRFAQRLGYRGYPPLVADVRALVRTELEGHEGAEAQQLQAGAAFFGVLRAQVDALQRAGTRLAPHLVREALSLLRSARHVYVVGQGLSSSLAQLLAELLRFLGYATTDAAADTLSLAMHLADVDENCVLVAVAAGPPSEETANALRYAREKGARTLAFTWSLTSPVAQAADLALPCGAVEVSPLTSVGVMAGLIDSVVQTLAADDVEGVQMRMERYIQARDYMLARKRR